MKQAIYFLKCGGCSKQIVGAVGINSAASVICGHCKYETPTLSVIIRLEGDDYMEIDTEEDED